MKYIKIILLIFWMLLIFDFSKDNGEVSTNKSDYVIEHVYKFMNKLVGKNVNQEDLELFVQKSVYVVRKCAHVMEYLILGLLMTMVISEYKSLDIKGLLFSFILCLLYAIGDEIHQLFISGRNGSFLDVLIDTLGIILGIGIYYYFRSRRQREK